MKKLSFTNKQMSQLLAWQEANKSSSEEAAVHFITTQQDIWSAWLSEDARKNLASLLK
jgi:glycine betaine/proline transport system substrate-binding protein